MKRVAIASLAVLAIVASLLGFIPKAHAATGGLTISPTSIDQKIAPGTTYKGSVLVINQGEADLGYRVYATPYSVNGEEYKPYFAPVQGATDISSWFIFDKTSGTLQANKQDTIPFSVSVPKGTGAGSYYATIFAETEDKGSSGVITRKRVGTVVYLQVTGNVIEKGSIEEWSVPWIQKAPLTASVKIANTGSVHFTPKIHVTVSDVFGGTKFSFDREPKVLPQKLRNVPISWQDGAQFGLFKVSGSVTYFGKTQKLPTKIVFVASTPMRLLSIGIVVAVVVGLVFVGKKRVVKK